MSKLKIFKIILTVVTVVFLTGCGESNTLSSRAGGIDYTRNSEEHSSTRTAINEIICSIPDFVWNESKYEPEIELVFSYPSQWSLDLDFMEVNPNRRETWYKVGNTTSPLAMAKPGDKVVVNLIQNYNTIETTEILLSQDDFINNTLHLSIYYF